MRQKPVVTFSAGDPPPVDLVQRGMGSAHLDDAVLRVARSVLRRDLDAAYAGFLRDGGFTTHLADDTGKVVVGPRFISFLGWPFSENLTPTQIADTLGLCRYVVVPSGIDTEKIVPFSETPEFGWAMAQATTATRRLLFSVEPYADINREMVPPRVAQILFAGKARGFLGVMPGIAEEAMCAQEAGLAVYIVGAFGGAARCLVEALTKPEWPDVFRLETHLSDPAFSRMLAGAASAGCADVPAAAFYRLQTTLASVRADLGRLRNGLDADENRELMLTSDMGKVVRLISKGLGQLGFN